VRFACSIKVVWGLVFKLSKVKVGWLGVSDTGVGGDRSLRINLSLRCGNEINR
jgi:hypothetical protein